MVAYHILKHELDNEAVGLSIDGAEETSPEWDCLPKDHQALHHLHHRSEPLMFPSQAQAAEPQKSLREI